MERIPEHRSQNFKAKNAFKPEELRRNRNELNVELRKQKREENLSKRRNLAIAAESEESEDEGISAASQQVKNLLKLRKDFFKLISSLLSRQRGIMSTIYTKN